MANPCLAGIDLSLRSSASRLRLTENGMRLSGASRAADTLVIDALSRGSTSAVHCRRGTEEIKNRTSGSGQQILVASCIRVVGINLIVARDRSSISSEWCWWACGASRIYSSTYTLTSRIVARFVYLYNVSDLWIFCVDKLVRVSKSLQLIEVSSLRWEILSQTGYVFSSLDQVRASVWLIFVGSFVPFSSCSRLLRDRVSDGGRSWGQISAVAGPEGPNRFAAWASLRRNLSDPEEASRSTIIGELHYHREVISIPSMASKV